MKSRIHNFLCADIKYNMHSIFYWKDEKLLMSCLKWWDVRDWGNNFFVILAIFVYLVNLYFSIEKIDNEIIHWISIKRSVLSKPCQKGLRF